MAMKLQTFRNIEKLIENHLGLTKDCFIKLHEKFPEVETMTLRSILSLHYQRHMKKVHWKLQSLAPQIYEEYKQAITINEPPGILMRIAIKYNFILSSVAKIILTQYCQEAATNDSFIQTSVRKLMKDATLIQDAYLAYEIHLCILFDDQNGPVANAVKYSIGVDYENKLQQIMQERNIIFRNEEYLRKDGYDKTPDIKLEIPIAINGFIITWVESKALFGHPSAHDGYIRDQYLSYWNRFGPGLVIYWFGYLETIVNPNEKKFIIRDKFPEQEEITFLNPQNVSLS